MTTSICDVCGDEEPEYDNDACTACVGTGKLYADCNDCGERFEWESGYGTRCAPCYSRIYGAASRGRERDWDAEGDAMRDDANERTRQ